MELMHHLIKDTEGKSSIFRFLMDMWKTKKIDCSSLSMRDLLVQAKIDDYELLLCFLQSGVAVSNNDIQETINSLSEDKLIILKLLLESCDAVDKTLLCQEAIKARKRIFVTYLLEEGACLPKDPITFLYNLFKIECIDGIKITLKMLNSSDIKKINLSKLIRGKHLLNPDLITDFIKAGVDPNGKKSPIAAIMNLNLLPDIQIDVVSVLINAGVDCRPLSNHSSTPLHVATELAIKSGKYLIKSHCKNASMYKRAL